MHQCGKDSNLITLLRIITSHVNSFATETLPYVAAAEAAKILNPSALSQQPKQKYREHLNLKWCNDCTLLTLTVKTPIVMYVIEFGGSMKSVETFPHNN